MPKAGWVRRGAHQPFRSRVRGNYFVAALVSGDIEAGRRIPEFVWDADKRFAWGGHLYPDSLIVAPELPIFQQLRNDPRLDSVSARADRDSLSGSTRD